MLRVATFNVNGIRAAQRRGFAAWRDRCRADVIGLQEVRCRVADLPEHVFPGYHLAYDAGTLAGRNGVALLTREAPVAVRSWAASALVRAPGDRHVELTGNGPDEVTLARELHAFAAEGRYLEADLAGVPLTVASVYLPKGGLPAELQVPGRLREAPDGGAKHLRKMSFMAGFAKHLGRARHAAAARGREYLVMGDLNIAHTRQDLRNWRANQKSEGFLPVERDWLGAQLGPRRLVDVVRTLHPGAEGPYSWWSWMGQSFARDVGWRIDYQLATPGLARAARAAWVDRDSSPEQRVSDHAPVVADYDV